MQNIEYNGKTINTNIFEESRYNLCNSIGKKQIVVNADRHETEQQLFDRCVQYCFTTIRIARTATTVAGYHKTIALCKR